MKHVSLRRLIMIDELLDIETLANALIALEEGAGDERRSAMWSLQKMLERKTRIVEEFEKEVA